MGNYEHYIDDYDQDFEHEDFLDMFHDDVFKSCRFCRSNDVEFVEKINAEYCYECGRIQ